MAEIKKVLNLLEMNLHIPNYQRPYKWSYRNMAELLSDICDATDNSKRYGDYNYRIGSVILHKTSAITGAESYNVVDGQQRILSLCLIMKYLKPDFHCSIFDEEFSDKETQENLRQNYTVVRDFFEHNENMAKSVAAALENIIEAVIIYVNTESEAFQLFDSQNTRGRPLNPHDLLKAYHLREMHNRVSTSKIEATVTKWENAQTKDIRELFGDYLFPIKCWTVGKKSHTFSAKDIECYKGVNKESLYSYAKRAESAKNNFQITSPFLSGESFFEMVQHYLTLLATVKKEFKCKFKDMYEITTKHHSTGFKYTTTLFYASLLAYYDKFKNFDERAVKKLFTWAFMLRVDMESLGYESINRYALGSESYSNEINMFAFIKEARLHTEIANLPISVARKDTKRPLNEAREDLHSFLKKISGLEI